MTDKEAEKVELEAEEVYAEREADERDERDQWMALADQGNKIQAIKAYCNAWGVTLRVAMAEVNRYLETAVIDEGRVGDFPQLDGYDDEMAAVCQALGIEPESWQVGGRTLEGAPFWALLTAEALCWAFVDRIEGKRSHLIFARYPEPTDAWALEAIRAAEVVGIRVEVTRVARTWGVMCYWLGDAASVWADPNLGEAVVAVLSVALKFVSEPGGVLEAPTGPSAR
jgi:hypothetical protein